MLWLHFSLKTEPPSPAGARFRQLLSVALTGLLRHFSALRMEMPMTFYWPERRLSVVPSGVGPGPLCSMAQSTGSGPDIRKQNTCRG
jgi:hypothetical protein